MDRANDEGQENAVEECLLDDIIEFAPEGGTKYRFGKGEVPQVAYCLPRQRGCVAEKFINLMNTFGTEGGFDEIRKTLRRGTPNEREEDSEPTRDISAPGPARASNRKPDGKPKPSLLAICHLALMISMPLKLFHYDYLEEFAAEFVACVLAHVESASTAEVKSLEPHNIDELLSSIIAVTYMSSDEKGDAMAESQEIKLKVLKKCLTVDNIAIKNHVVNELSRILSNMAKV